MQLNTHQQEFCDMDGGAIRLLAPAGCGKTQSLLWRCLHLLEKNTSGDPLKFLLFTFTKVAKDELMDRVRSTPALNKLAPHIHITTLNSWGFRRLKESRHSLKLIITQAEKSFCINNTLQPVWNRDDQPLKALLTDARRKFRASKTVAEMLDMLKSLRSWHRLPAVIPKRSRL